MELSIFQQISENIKNAQKIGVLLPVKSSLDHAASAFALVHALRKAGKEVRLLSSNTSTPVADWLPGAEPIASTFGGKSTLDITLSTQTRDVDEIRYEINESGAHILITAKDGSFAPSDVSVRQLTDTPDALFLIGCQSLENLGEVFEASAEVFYNTPKINIDNNPNNTFFANINLVQITSASLAELVNNFIKELKIELDEQVATLLLSGIISATYSFQESNTTPDSLLAAADLVNAGADQQLIIRHLYKTKKLRSLKLWGRTLARLKTDETAKLMYSVLSPQDFERSESTIADVTDAIRESLDNISDYKIVAVISENQDKVVLSLATHSSIDPTAIIEAFQKPDQQSVVGQGEHRDYSLLEINISGMNPTDAENKLVEIVSQ